MINHLHCGCNVTLHGPTLADRCFGGSFILFMSILEHFLRSQCDIEDPCGQITSIETPNEAYDFIVVGGGSAGSVVANRLSEVPEWSVLLVEAGVNEPTGSQVPSMFPNFIGSSVDWQYKTEPEQHACLGLPEQRCPWPRGKVIGGTSVLNGMMYMRGSRKDFSNWEKLGNNGWSYEDVLPYYLKSENNLQLNLMDKGYHAKGGYLPVTQFSYHPPLAEDILKAAEEIGYRVGDLNGEKHTGFAIAQTTSFSGKRFSSSRAFLRPIKYRKNLHILLNTTVARVLVDKDTKTVNGIEIIKADGKKEKIQVKKEVVVSGGAVNSPQVLLLSGIGPEEDLKKVGVSVVQDLPGVGKNLHNHVAFNLKFYLNENNTDDLNWATAMEYMLKRDGIMSSTGLSQVTGLINTKYSDPSEDHPDIQIFFDGFLANCAKTGVVGEIEGQTPDQPTPQKTISMSTVMIQPKSRGFIELRDNSPLSHPKIYANYLSEKIDLERLIDGVKKTLQLSKAEALKKHELKLDTTPVKKCESETFGTDKYWECAIRQNTFHENHQAGSCKMGPVDDKLAVVDNRLRVHGIKRLRVMDTSIMPQVTTSNTNAPAIMIAEKGTDMVKEDWLKNYKNKLEEHRAEHRHKKKC